MNNARSVNVESFAVCTDAVIDGKRIHNHRLSREFSTRDKAQQALSQMIGQFPDAAICGTTRFFNPNSPEDVEERVRFIRSLA
jgi:hypothetical protein